MQPMSPRTAAALTILNRRFYTRHATSFSDRRGRPWPGWQKVRKACDRQPTAPLSVLDAGCGNGRFGAFLLGARPGPLDYTGLDFCPELLAEARRALDGQVPAERFLELDLLAADLEPALGARRFDLIVLFGVLHHVPGFEQRRELLVRLGERLAPGGTLAATFWRFVDAERLGRKVVPWEKWQRESGEPIDLDELEPGDLLLDWDNDTSHPRYCHLASDDEIAALLAALPLRCRARFVADGNRTNVHNDYVLLEATR